MLLVFWIVFSVPVISRIESIGGGWVGGGWGGWEGGGVGGGGGWGAVGGLKHPFGLKGQCYAFSMRHRLVESTREAKTAVRSSLVPHTVLSMPMKCTLVV